MVSNLRGLSSRVRPARTARLDSRQLSIYGCSLMFEQVGRSTPFISINKLAEYVNAGVLSRTRIIEDQKFPKRFKQLLYRECFPAIQAFLADPDRDGKILEKAIVQLQRASLQTAKQDEQRFLKIEALEHVLNARHKLTMPWTFRPLQLGGRAGLKIDGVEVSVRPELQITEGKSPGGETHGFLKLCLSKTLGLNKERGAYVGTLLHQYAATKFSEHAVDRNKIIVLDVFSETIYVAPANYLNRRKELAACCMDIQWLWNSPHINGKSAVA
jgi:hypothetical protein